MYCQARSNPHRSTSVSIGLRFRKELVGIIPRQHCVRGASFGHVVALVSVWLATLVAFLPVLRSGFVNWDDPFVILNNQELGGPHAVRWAFTTTLIGHYQPLAWLAWSAVKSAFGSSPQAFHGVSLLAHLVNVALVYVVVWRLTAVVSPESRDRLIAALAAALLFAVHPVRVEAVAWASAFPYELSLVLVLLAFLAYLNSCCARSRDGRRPLIWLGLSLAGYVASLLTRATAIGFPVVLWLVDFYPLRRRTAAGRLILEKIPFVGAAIAAVILESHAREMASLQDVAVGARLTMAVKAPFGYFGRTVWPVRLTPLDPLPISPALERLPLLIGLIALLAVSAAVWKQRVRWPALVVAWTAYVVLLAPVAGLTPSGLQATADRYMYVPAVVVSALAGAIAVRVRSSSRATTARLTLTLAVTLSLAVAMIAALGGLTWRQAGWWHDSITLWSRAVDLDPRNDIALYNLATALSDAGREREAMARYEETLRLIPDHTLARQNLSALRAKQAERDADRLVEAGRLDEASGQYARAIALDSSRQHARAARGIVLLRLGRTTEAVAELRAAYDAGVRDAAVLNGLAFSLMETGRPAAAVDVLKQGVEQYPSDVDMAHNLARLLATAADAHVRDGALALRLALDVDDRTGGRDPRALDTLAAAYAAVGRFDLARETSHRAVSRAREVGDLDLAQEIAAHAGRYRR